MKNLALVAFAILFTTATVGQQAQQNGDGRAPAANATGQPAASGKMMGNLEVLTDTQGIDFGPYLSKVVQAVRKNWYSLIPEEARAPGMKSGKVAIQFVILRNGKVGGMRLVGLSGDLALDRAAWGGVTASVPFADLPAKFTGPYLELRFNFYYNPKKGEVESNDQNQKSAH